MENADKLFYRTVILIEQFCKIYNIKIWNKIVIIEFYVMLYNLAISISLYYNNCKSYNKQLLF